jgi:hypothetical protein
MAQTPVAKGTPSDLGGESNDAGGRCPQYVLRGLGPDAADTAVRPVHDGVFAPAIDIRDGTHSSSGDKAFADNWHGP